jgi:hypothetical protein
LKAVLIEQQIRNPHCFGLTRQLVLRMVGESLKYILGFADWL